MEIFYLQTPSIRKQSPIYRYVSTLLSFYCMHRALISDKITSVADATLNFNGTLRKSLRSTREIAIATQLSIYLLLNFRLQSPPILMAFAVRNLLTPCWEIPSLPTYLSCSAGVDVVTLSEVDICSCPSPSHICYVLRPQMSKLVHPSIYGYMAYLDLSTFCVSQHNYFRLDRSVGRTGLHAAELH